MGRAEDIFNRIREHGQAAIEEFIANAQSEELFLDFKCSADCGNGKKLHETDLNNFRKAISGFANSEGGVIVWGVVCAPNNICGDVASSKALIINTKRFLSWLEGAVSGCTIPPHKEVVNFAIPIDAEGRGFVATLIPKSNLAPHQTVGDVTYYMRAGSSFSRVPHSVLAGMFGKRPTPEIFMMFSVVPSTIRTNPVGVKGVSLECGFILTHRSPTIVRDLFFSSMFLGGGTNCAVSWQADSTSGNWEGNFAFGVRLGLVSKEGFRLPPEMVVQPVTLKAFFAPPFESFNLTVYYGCSGSPIHEINIARSANQITQLWDDLKIESLHDGAVVEKFTNKLLLDDLQNQNGLKPI